MKTFLFGTLLGLLIVVLPLAVVLLPMVPTETRMDNIIVGVEPVSIVEMEVNIETFHTLPAIEVKDDRCTEYFNYVASISDDTSELEWFNRVMWCESRCDPKSYNTSSGATGLMQFMDRTWRWRNGKDIWDWKEQVRLAHQMYQEGMQSHWECK